MAYPGQPRTTLDQLCTTLWDSQSWLVVIQPGIEPGSVMWPLALRCSALDRCAAREPIVTRQVTIMIGSLNELNAHMSIPMWVPGQFHCQWLSVVFFLDHKHLEQFHFHWMLMNVWTGIYCLRLMQSNLNVVLSPLEQANIAVTLRAGGNSDLAQGCGVFLVRFWLSRTRLGRCRWKTFCQAGRMLSCSLMKTRTRMDV